MSNRKGESRLRTEASELLRHKAGMFVSAVEGGGFGGTPGIPDLHYCGVADLMHVNAAGEPAVGMTIRTYVEGWIEFKACNIEDVGSLALREAAPVTRPLAHYNERQRIWHRKACRAGAACHLWLQIYHPDAPPGRREWNYIFWADTAAQLLGKTMMFRHFQPYSVLDADHRPHLPLTAGHLMRALRRRTHTGTVIS